MTKWLKSTRNPSLQYFYTSSSKVAFSEIHFTLQTYNTDKFFISLFCGKCYKFISTAIDKIERCSFNIGCKRCNRSFKIDSPFEGLYVVIFDSNGSYEVFTDK